MPKIVSSSEAKARFGEYLKWAAERNDQIIIKLYGEPAAVIMSYAEYEEMEKLRKREQKRKVLEALETLRQEARIQNPRLAAEDAYRAAGFSEELVQEMLQADLELAAAQS